MRKKGIAVDGASGGPGGAGLLPQNPSLEHLKNEAKQRLKAMRRAGAPDAKLADVQLAVARDYGFANWRALKSRVQPAASGAFAAYAGHYRHDPELLTNSVQTVTLEDGRLFMQQTGGGKLALIREDDGGFTQPGLRTRYTFDQATADQPATALTAHLSSGDVQLKRIDAATAARVEAAYLRATEDQARHRAEIALRPEVIQRYVGWYASKFGAVIEVKREGARLKVQPSGQASTEFHPESETKFFSRLVAAQLSFETRGSMTLAAVLHQNGREQRLLRVLPEEARGKVAEFEKRLAEQERPRTIAKIDPAVMADYAGVYRIDGQRTATVDAEDGRLFVEITDQRRHEVYPEGEHDFFWTVVAAQITFVADEAGRITHAVLHQGGRDMPWPRIA